MRGKKITSGFAVAVAASLALFALPGGALAVPPPDLGLTRFSESPQLVARGGGSTAAFSATGAAADAVLTVTVSTGLTVTQLSDDAGTPIPCTGVGPVYTCDLGPTPGQSLLNVGYAVATATPVGTAASISATITPVPGPDPTPADNTATASVRVVSKSVLTQAVTPKHLVVPIGGRATIRLVVRNAGPDPATNVHVRFAVQSNDAKKPVLSAFSSPNVVADNGTVTWRAGTIAAGSSAALVVTVSVSVKTTSSALFYATSADGVAELCDSLSCENAVTIRSAAPAASASPTPTPTRSTSSAPTRADPVLPDTGASVRWLLALVAALVLCGGGLLWATRRTPVGGRGH